MGITWSERISDGGRECRPAVNFASAPRTYNTYDTSWLSIRSRESCSTLTRTLHIIRAVLYICYTNGVRLLQNRVNSSNTRCPLLRVKAIGLTGAGPLQDYHSFFCRKCRYNRLLCVVVLVFYTRRVHAFFFNKKQYENQWPYVPLLF